MKDKQVSFLETKLSLFQAELNKYLEFIHDLLENYSLPENLQEELEGMRNPNPQLFREENSSARTFSSTGHYIPVKDANLQITHEKHKDMVPVLDFSKLGASQVMMIKGEKDEEGFESDEMIENSNMEEGSQLNSQDIINALNEDSSDIPEIPHFDNMKSHEDNDEQEAEEGKSFDEEQGNSTK